MASSSTSVVPSDASDVADPLTSQFQALMQRACSLLHHLDRQLNWDAAAAFDSNTHHNKASPGGAVAASNEATHFDNAACSNGNYVEGDEDMQSDSSDDDGMVLFGGGLLDSDSDNDDEPMGCDAPSSLKSEHQEECYEDENYDEGGEEEDDATMLQRASSVHVALLTSLSMASLSLQKSSSHHQKGGRRELVQALVSYILSSKSPSSNSGGDECKKTNKNNDAISAKLGNIMSYILSFSSSSSNNNDFLPKQMSLARKRKISLTNSLLTIQYLLHLLEDNTSSSSSTPPSTSLLGWNVVILPLLFGSNNNNNIKLTDNDTLRDAILNLISLSSPSSIPATQEQIISCKVACELCTSAIDQLTNTTTTSTASAISSSSSSSSLNKNQRQSQLVLVCNVLIRLYDGMNELLNKQQRTINQQQSKVGGEALVRSECVDIVANAIHLSILKIIRCVCYAQVVGSNKEGDTNRREYEPLLSLEAVRAVTGMLLPKLYPSDICGGSNSGSGGSNSGSGGGGGGGGGDLKGQQRRSVELWNEILLLLSPYSDEISIDNSKCCRNWESVAPMTATAILCILLPSFRSKDLPTVPVTTDKIYLSSFPSCRPVFQPSLWTLIRQSLKRCGDTDSFGGGEGGQSGGRGTSLLSRGARDGSSAFAAYDDDDVTAYDRAAIDQLLRRRSAHIVRLLIEYERDSMLRNGSKKWGEGRESKHGSIDNQKLADMWIKYVLCFEMLEMEIEIHLVDQVWTTVKELTSEVSTIKLEDTNELFNELPTIVWEDVASLLCRVLLSDAPTLRKLGLYRFLSGDSGIQVTPAASNEENQNGNGRVFMRKAETKCKVKKKSGGGSSFQSVPITSVSVSFVLDILMRSYDSIVGTKVGTNMQIDEGGQQKSEKVADFLSEFLSNYVISLATSSDDCSVLSEFMKRILAAITTLKWRSLVLLFRAVATALDHSACHKFALEQETVRTAIKDMSLTLSSGGAPKSLQEGLRKDLALMLKNAVPWEHPDVSVVLEVLSLYPPQDDVDNTDDEIHSLTRCALAVWIMGLGHGQWAKTAGPVCSSAFVMGEILPFDEKNDILSGVKTLERAMGMAICLLCTLAGNASEMLWPAIFKGLHKSLSASSCKAIRSMILLEWGCRLEVLSGMGNGDILTDKNNCMMPPPPNVEFLLSNAVQLLMTQVKAMKSSLGGGGEKSGAMTRYTAAGHASSYIYTLINQIRVLHRSFPSSESISLSVNTMLQKSSDSLKKAQTNLIDTGGPVDIVVTLTTCYASLSCDAKFENGEELERLLSTCKAILSFELLQVKSTSMRKESIQALRSVFHYAKWGSLSLLTPMINEAAKQQPGDLSGGSIQQIYHKILAAANDAVNTTPTIALPPLFACITSCGEYLVELEDDSSNGTSLLASIGVVSEILFAVLNEQTPSSTWMHMLSAMCNLLFSPKLLLHEYHKSYVDGDRNNMPVMQSFEKLIQMGSAWRPHINIVAVSYISVAWLGEQNSIEVDVGLAAIPYRDLISDLLVYKEPKIDESSANQTLTRGRWDGILPRTADGSSITRSFLLWFLSKLPSPEGLSNVVLKELVHHIILKLVDTCCQPAAKGKPFISGSEEYSKMMRSWQALCLLSRFVTSEIANEVAQKVFRAMSNLSHGQIRYFMEVFTIQCTRKHSSVFGQYFINEIRRNDLSLQYVSSLMIIGGNLTVGRYSNDFFHSKSDQKIKEILCGVLPWLSSTQGFSRAIAQLLVYRLIPLVVEDVDSKSTGGAMEHDHAVLRSVYMFLQQNQDMSRLRVKQQSFFDSYDVDTTCQFEGLFSFDVDDGDEASPMHMVDAIKECLAEVYKEVHDVDAPEWKQMEDLLISAEGIGQVSPTSADVLEPDDLVNFQRKILPFDTLDLRIQSLHENKKFNAAGYQKQHLIVCATLVDKVPNLAGLARTAEIFAAETLVLPNILVKKQDDFKSISASANDWIDIEECKEEDLLSWLHKKKSQGYTVVGLEQTSSSKCLMRFSFPDMVVLLLGKEKEGIPVEFLSAVDHCIAIPQLGIIRSLNVHVSGALTIWEYSRQMMEKKRRK